MKSVLRCPGCRTEFDAKSGKLGHGGVQCPSCLTTVPVFDEDTRVPGISGDSVVVNPSHLRIDGYEILGTIGHGGMGTVIEAKQTSLGRRVAVKVLSPTLARDGRFVERFEREAAALASLSHPNIVTILERGRSADSVYFIMEYVEGLAGGAPTDLRGILNERRLSVAEVTHFAGQIAKALAYAHDNGIVHRDIKPGNVIIDRHGNAKVADFGIASVTNQQLDSRLTSPAASMGTLDYMAPEQRDDAAAADARADVYSLGVLVYEMLTGKLPRGAYAPASSLAPGISPRWDELIASALQPQPENRLASMVGFRQRLEYIQLTHTSLTPAISSETWASRDVALQCPECDIGVSKESKYCPKCRTPQWFDCSDCKTPVHAGATFCLHCGRHVQRQRLQIKHLETARRELALAKNESSPLKARCQHAGQAGIAATRLVRISSDDTTATALLASANRLQLKLAQRAANEAYREKRYGDTLALLNQILDVDPEHATAQKLSAKLLKLKADTLAKAQEHRVAGSPIQAISVLEALVKVFTDDVEIDQQLEECRQLQNRATEVVQTRIPTLASENRWNQVRQELSELHDMGVRVNGLGQYEATVHSRLAFASTLLKQAEEKLEQDESAEATRIAEQILQQVSDCPKAREMLEAASRNAVSQSTIRQQIEQACTERRWFLAMSLFDGTNANDTTMLRLLSCAQDGKRTALEYSRLVLWCVLGTIMLIAAGYLSQLFFDGLSSVETPSASVWQIAGRSSCFAISSSLAMWFIRRLLARPVPFQRFLGWSALWLLGIGLAIAGSVAIREKSLAPWIAWGWEGVTISVFTSMAIALAFRDLLVPPTRRLWAVFLTGAIAMAVVVLSSLYAESYARYVVASIWLFAAMQLSGTALHWYRMMLLIVVGLVAGVIGVGVAKSASGSPAVMQFAIAFMLLFATAVLLGAKRTLASSIALAVTTAVVVYTSDWLSSRSIETMWWVMSAYLAHEAGPLLDRRLHLVDRYRTRPGNRSVSQPSTPGTT